MAREDFLPDDSEEMEVPFKKKKHFCTIHGIEWFETPLRNKVCPLCLKDREESKEIKKKAEQALVLERMKNIPEDAKLCNV